MSKNDVPITSASGIRAIRSGMSMPPRLTGDMLRNRYSGAINTNMQVKSISEDTFRIFSQTHIDNIQKNSIHTLTANSNFKLPIYCQEVNV